MPTVFSILKKAAVSPWFRAGLLFAICIVVTLQALSQDQIANFIIFKTASERFLAFHNMYDYIQYGIIYDRFFYSPQFALLFAPFIFMPTTLSVFLWLLLGASILFLAIEKLPVTAVQKCLIYFIVLIDLVNSLQNLQTNALNTALMLFIFICVHNNKPLWAALCVAICLSIKIYPAAAALLFLFYPGKIKFVVWSVVFTLLLFTLPYLFVPQHYFITSLKYWSLTVLDDASDKFIYNSPSLVGLNYTWLDRPMNHFYLELVGFALTLIPLLKLVKKQTDKNFALLYLAFIMLFVVIFNHATESPTYVIAITGAAVWYVVSPRSFINNALLVLLFIGCILVPTDIYPKWLRTEYFMPLKIRVVPCLLIWIKLFYELMSYKIHLQKVTE